MNIQSTCSASKQPRFYFGKVNDANVEAAYGGSHSFSCFAQHGSRLNISLELSRRSFKQDSWPNVPMGGVVAETQ